MIATRSVFAVASELDDDILFSVRLSLFKQISMALEGDESRAALEGQVGPCPLEQHQETVAKAYQVEDVDAQPHGPGQEAREADRDHFDNGKRTSYCCQVCLVAIVDWPNGRARIYRAQGVGRDKSGPYALSNHRGDVATLLH